MQPSTNLAGRRSRHSASPSVPLCSHPYAAEVSRRDTGVMRGKFAPLPPPWSGPVWTDLDEAQSQARQPQRLFDSVSSGKLARPAARRSDVTSASYARASLASSITASELGTLASVRRSPRTSDSTVDSSLTFVSSSSRRDSSGGFANVFRLSVRSASVPLDMGAGTAADCAESTRSLSPQTLHVLHSKSVPQPDWSTCEGVPRSQSAPAPDTDPCSPDWEGDESPAPSNDGVEHTPLPALLDKLGVDGVGESGSEAQLKHVCTLLQSELLAKQELQQLLRHTRARYSADLQARKVQQLLEAEAREATFARALQASAAAAAESEAREQRLVTQEERLQGQLRARGGELEGLRALVAAAQGAAAELSAQNARLLAESVSKQADAVVAEESSRAASISSAGGGGSCARGGLQSPDAAGSRSVRALENQVVQLQEQLSCEVSARLSAEASMRDTHAAATERVAACVALHQQLQAQVHAAREEVQQREEAHARAQSQMKCQVDAMKSHHSATLSDALRAHDSDVREAVGRAVAAEGKRLAGLVQAAVDEVETRHRHDIKAAVAAAHQSNAQDVADAQARTEEVRRECALSLEQSQLHLASQLLHLSAQHEQDSGAASLRLRAMTERREAAEAHAQLLAQQLQEQAGVVQGLRMLAGELCETLVMAQEDAQAIQRETMDREAVKQETALTSARAGWSVELQGYGAQWKEVTAAEVAAKALEMQHKQELALQELRALCEEERRLSEVALCKSHAAALELAHSEWQAKWTQCLLDHEQALARAEEHRLSAVAATMEEREEDRVLLMQRAQVLAAQAGEAAHAAAKAEYVVELQHAEAAFQKRIAAKMAEMTEGNQGKVAAAIKTCKNKADASLSALAKCHGQELALQHKKHEEELKIAHARQEASAQRAELIAGQLAVMKAQQDRESLLSEKLKKRMTLAQVQLAHVYARALSALHLSSSRACAREQELVTRVHGMEQKVRTLTALKGSMSALLDKDLGLEVAKHKELVGSLQAVIKKMYEVRTQHQGVKEHLRKELVIVEGFVASTERDIREVSSCSSLLRDGGVDFELSKRKRRLNADLDSLLEKLQDRRAEFTKMDEKLQLLENSIEEKEAEVRTIEGAHADSLASQLQALYQLLSPTTV